MPSILSPPGGNWLRAFSMRYIQSCSLSTNSSSCNKTAQLHLTRPGKVVGISSTKSLTPSQMELIDGCIGNLAELKYQISPGFYHWEMFSSHNDNHRPSFNISTSMKISFACGCHSADGHISDLVHPKVPSPFLPCTSSQGIQISCISLIAGKDAQEVDINKIPGNKKFGCTQPHRCHNAFAISKELLHQA